MSYVGRFSGKRYPYGTGRGDCSYKPQKNSWQGETLPIIQKLLKDNKEYLPLRPRAILYRLMGMRKATKADDGRVTALIASARRGGHIPWEAIDDGRTVTYDIGGYDDPADYWGSIQSDIQESYRRALRQGQEWHIELWVESAGYLPVLQRTAALYGAKLVSGSGFNPILEIRKSAQAAAWRYVDTRQRTVILYLGDCDKAGATRIDRTDADMRQFLIDGMNRDRLAASGLTPEDVCEYIMESEHLGLTRDQAVLLGLLDEKGVKARKGKPWKFELEAVAPGTVVAWVVEACERYTDMDVLDSLKAQADQERLKMAESMKRLAKRWKAA